MFGSYFLPIFFMEKHRQILIDDSDSCYPVVIGTFLKIIHETTFKIRVVPTYIPIQNCFTSNIL